MNFLSFSMCLLAIPLMFTLAACNEEACPKQDDCGPTRSSGFGCTRVPLEVFVAEGFGTSIPVESETFRCGSNGVGFPPIERMAGCGFVTYSDPGLLHTDSVYELESGALVGAFLEDDIGHTLDESSCFDAAYVAGTMPPRDCADVVRDGCWFVDPRCPEQTPPGPGRDCCVDDTACTPAEPFTTFPNGPTIASTIETICAEREGCPANLEAALVEPYCASMHTGCGLISVRGYDSTLSHGVTAFFDAASGELVGAGYTTSSARTAKIGGCCGIHFAAGTTHAGCDDVVEGVCQRAP